MAKKSLLPVWMRDILNNNTLRGKIERAIMDLKPITVYWSGPLGAGHYGVAFPTVELNGPATYVVKITRDPTEGPMQAWIQKQQEEAHYGMREAFARVFGVWKLEREIDWRGKKWPVYVILREDIKPVRALPGWDHLFFGKDDTDFEGITEPKVRRWQLKRGLKGLGNYMDLSRRWYEMKKKQEAKKLYRREQEMAFLEGEMYEAIYKISDAFPYIGEAMAEMQGHDTPMQDVHGGNIGVRIHEGMVDESEPGRNIGAVIIFDPGHTPSGEAAKLEPGLTRINPVVQIAPGFRFDPNWSENKLAFEALHSLVAAAKNKTLPFDDRITYLRRAKWISCMYKTSSEMARASLKVVDRAEEEMGLAHTGSWCRAMSKAESMLQPDHVFDSWASEWLPTGWQGNLSNNPYPEPVERILINPAKQYADVFGIPPEAHVVPVYPRKRKTEGPVVKMPDDVAKYLSQLETSPVERFLVVLLDSKHAITGVAMASQGTLNASTAHPREIYAIAIASRAESIILVHNHPSGSLVFSQDDKNAAAKITDAGRIIGIPVLDHILIGRDGNFASMQSMGLM